MPGGLIQFAQTVLGFVAFRSNNRIMALAFLFFARRLAGTLRGKRPAVVLSVCGVLLAFGRRRAGA